MHFDFIDHFIRLPRVATPDFFNLALLIDQCRGEAMGNSAAGTTSETLSRTLAKFRDQNLLRVKGNTITLTKPGELRKLLQRNLGES